METETQSYRIEKATITHIYPQGVEFFITIIDIYNQKMYERFLSYQRYKLWKTSILNPQPDEEYYNESL
jgi:hypothetical protein